MRFCMITTFYPPYNFGGDGIFVQRLSNELARRGHHVEVVHCADSYRLLAGKEPPPGPADHPNVTVHRLESPFGFLSPLATQQTGRPWFKAGRLREILAQGFDVIHYHNISLVGGPQVLAYGQGVKLYTLHEYWLVCPTHVLFRYNRAPCLEPHCLTCTLVHKRPPQWWRYTSLLAQAVKHVDAFLSPSPFTRHLHRERGLDIPTVDLPYFIPEAEPGEAPPPNGRPAGRPYFLYVGRLEKIKGLHTVLPLFREHRKARLLVAGAGAEEAQLKRMAGGDENIVFLGRQSHAQLAPLYRDAAAVIVPSINFEVLPMVIFEAFQHGTPVVVRNLGGMPLIVNESGAGMTFDTEAELRAALDTLLDQPSVRAEMGRRARQMYTARLTPDAHLETYFQLIDRLAKARLTLNAAARQPIATGLG
jgi:glycosyltransferase involved in cell wall biosynthesis